MIILVSTNDHTYDHINVCPNSDTNYHTNAGIRDLIETEKALLDWYLIGEATYCMSPTIGNYILLIIVLIVPFHHIY